MQFWSELRSLSDRAEDEARECGSPQVESEHLLLAMAGGAFGSASRVLEGLGVSRDHIAAALDREHVGALALAGVDPRGVPRPRRLRGHRRLRWGRSAMLAAERSVDEAPDEPALRMLMGIVHAGAGVVPRLLLELGVTAAEVAQAVRNEPPRAPA